MIVAVSPEGIFDAKLADLTVKNIRILRSILDIPLVYAIKRTGSATIAPTIRHQNLSNIIIALFIS